MRTDIAPGRTSPDHGLPDQERVPRRLNRLQGDDLPTPRLHEAWDAGDMSRFHGRAGRGATHV